MGDEELYAKLGTVIGYEISHAFDPKGSQFDKDGKFQKSAKYCGDTPLLMRQPFFYARVVTHIP